jgi:hypothetical protein
MDAVREAKRLMKLDERRFPPIVDRKEDALQHASLIDRLHTRLILGQMHVAGYLSRRSKGDTLPYEPIDFEGIFTAYEALREVLPDDRQLKGEVKFLVDWIQESDAFLRKTG